MSNTAQPGSYREKLLQLNTRSYLDETVVPVMMQALAAVSRERPEDPIDYVAHFLMKHNPKRLQEAQRGTATASSHGGYP